jgi:hypothetical protein
MTSGEEYDEAADQSWHTGEALRRLIGQREAKRLLEEMDAAQQRAEHPDGRWMNLDQYLDGEYVAPKANLGATRDDNIQFLYPGKWHTLIGLTTAGKTFWALWQAKAVMEDGGHVIYIHFEEPNPGRHHRPALPHGRR